MIRTRLFIFALLLNVAACSSVDTGGTIAQLRERRVEITEEEIADGLEKAMASYQRFLAETPDSALVPEAIRRLADLKVEKEYGLTTGGEQRGATTDDSDDPGEPAVTLEAVEAPAVASPPPARVSAPVPGGTDADFEARASGSIPFESSKTGYSAAGRAVDDLEKAGPLEAIALYKKLLQEYPHYERNDQVLYQMSRAYEELGRIEEAMTVMNRMVAEYPGSRYLGEVQFRRAEYFFTRRNYFDAEEAYKSIVDIGVGSSFYQLALYKLGWAFYKQELYERALHEFIALLDHKESVGYDFEQTDDETERKRMDDTFRVISLSFSYLGGAESVVDYFSRYGKRDYEDRVYSNLGEYYFNKRRYADAVETYNAFVQRNPYHRMAPNFHMRVIEINMAGGFPTLVIDAKKSFATNYGLRAEYWQHFEPDGRPEVLGFLKTNLTDLANHYHALYQNPKFAKEKAGNFDEALHWYREFLASFPKDDESPVINYQLADLLLENESFAGAATEYEKTAYDYPEHEKSSRAGYAAVYAYRQHLETVTQADELPVMHEIVRSSLKFADTFPEHEKAAVVLGAAADDLYAMGEHEEALKAARDLLGRFPLADGDVRRSAWLVDAHSTYELQRYPEAETAYVKVLELLPESDKARGALVDNLAAAIYKQGEQADAAEDFAAAAEHYLRVGKLATTSSIRPTAEYDAAAALIKLEAWERAIAVLSGFRNDFPGHELQHEVTKKIAHVYRQSGRIAQAASEYERIEREAENDEVRREALLVAAEMHHQSGNEEQTLVVYRRYVDYFPQPVETNLVTRGKIAEILKARDERDAYLSELERIVAIEKAAGEAQTDLTRQLAAGSARVLAEEAYKRFKEVELVQPFEENLRRKQMLMKTATADFGRLLDYEIGEVTAAATFYLADIYAHFSKALMESERPEGLPPLEREQYELAIEEQAYPFEEKAISVHESNLELMAMGIYNEWIERSLERLARFVPARYDRPEEKSAVVTSPAEFTFAYGEVDEPASPVGEQFAEQPQEGQGEAKASLTPAAQADELMTYEPPPSYQAAQYEEEVTAEDSAPMTEPATGKQPLLNDGGTSAEKAAAVGEAVPVEGVFEEQTTQEAVGGVPGAAQSAKIDAETDLQKPKPTGEE